MWDGSGSWDGSVMGGSGTECDGNVTDAGKKCDGNWAEMRRKWGGNGTEVGRKRDGSGRGMDGNGTEWDGMGTHGICCFWCKVLSHSRPTSHCRPTPVPLPSRCRPPTPVPLLPHSLPPHFRHHFHFHLKHGKFAQDLLIIFWSLACFSLFRMNNFLSLSSRPYRSQQNASEESKDFASGMANLFRQTSALSSLVAFDLFGVTHTRHETS